MKISKFHTFIILLLVIVTIACDDSITNDTVEYPPDNQNKVTISQGVWGNVWFWEGNFMPVSANGSIKPVIREVHIYEATTHNSVTKDADNYSFIIKIDSKFITKVVSDKDGFFQVDLDPGKYSCFVKEGLLFWGNLTDGDDHLVPAIVDSNSVTKRQIDINYSAAY